MNSEVISIYSDQDLQKMRISCSLARDVLLFIEPYVKPGITTGELDKLCYDYIVSNKAFPAPLNYKGFPKSTCISVNDVVCHGIPGTQKLKDGDIANIDVTVIKDGWFGDTSKTFIIGNPSKLVRDLVKVTEESMYIGIENAIPGNTFGDIGYAIANFVEKHGYSVVRDYCGHGIGLQFHESPMVLHYGKRGEGPLIKPGMFFTIEPMVNVGSYKVKVLKDGWTAVTADKSLSAQFEHTIAINNSGNEILTK